MSLTATIVVALACLVLEGFFSGSEIALVSANRIRLRRKAGGGSRGAAIALDFLESGKEPGATLVGTNLCVVTSTILVTLQMLERFGEHGEVITVLIMSPILLIFAEIIPKSFYQRNADRLAPLVAYPLYGFYYLFLPFIWTFIKLARGFLKVLGIDLDERGPFVTRDQLRLMMVPGSRKSNIRPDEQLMIRRIFDFSNATVREAMRPLVEVHAFEEKTTVEQALREISNDIYSRYPVFEERIVRITGLVRARDLLYCGDEAQTLRKLKKPVVYVTENQNLEAVLWSMQKEGASMAVAVDEYGGAVGIITLEDILEEIVGEIEDEYDVTERMYRRIDDRTFAFGARMEIDRINELFNFRIPKGDYETLGGFVLDRCNRIPKPWTSFAHGGLTFIVSKSSDRAVEEVQIRSKSKVRAPDGQT